MNGFYTKIAKLKCSSLTVYRKWEGNKTKKMECCDLLKNFDGKKTDNEGNVVQSEKIQPYCGQVTKGSRKRMIDMIHLFCESTKKRWVYNKYVKKRVQHQFSFITLTIPMNERRIKGKEGYDKLLEPFLFWLIKTKNCNTYFWKAELQSPLNFQGKLKLSLGQLHYHILIPNFIDKNEIRKKWNYILKQNGLLEQYFELTGNYNAPSTAIERPYKVKHVAEYVIKEITKNCNSSKQQVDLVKKRDNCGENGYKGCEMLMNVELELLNEVFELANTPLGGKVWGCSRNLSPKRKIILGLENDAKEYSDKIVFYKEQIEKQSFFDFDFWQKNQFYNEQLRYLQGKFKKCYAYEKNYFEIDFTEKIKKRLDYCYNYYEEVADWDKNKNIYENDYVVIYRLPSEYKDILLDTRERISINGEIHEIFYLDEIKNFIKNRVGEVFTEKKIHKKRQLKI